jgi:hypothetical protein
MRACGRSIAALLVVAQLAGCATKPADIPGRYMSPLVFAQASCGQLVAELATIDQRMLPLHHKIHRNVTTDAIWVSVYVPLLILLPFTFFMLKGNGSEYEEYSSLLGQRQAVQQQMDQKHCAAGS